MNFYFYLIFSNKKENNLKYIGKMAIFFIFIKHVNETTVIHVHVNT